MHTINKDQMWVRAGDWPRGRENASGAPSRNASANLGYIFILLTNETAFQHWSLGSLSKHETLPLSKHDITWSLLSRTRYYFGAELRAQFYFLSHVCYKLLKVTQHWGDFAVSKQEPWKQCEHDRVYPKDWTHTNVFLDDGNGRVFTIGTNKKIGLLKLKQGNGYKHERNSCEADIQTDGRTDGRTDALTVT